MADPAISEYPLDHPDGPQGFKRDGFKGMRRTAINQFAKPFFFYHKGKDDEGNTIDIPDPNGTIEPFPDDMNKPALDSMMSLHLSQGKFGADPFNLRPQDKMAALEKQILELKERWESGTQRRSDPIPHDLLVETIAENQAVDDRVLGTPLEDLSWQDLKHRAKVLGIDPWKKSRAVVTALIEGREAE